VRVKPGARIPLDGQVTAGSSAVNQAPVTGESIPIDKVAGDPVFAGTINETGILEFRVTAAADNTTLARIIHAVEQAQGTQAPTQRFVDRFAAIYTPAVFGIAVAVAILTPWLLGWTWTQALYKALVLLVIACPCALVLATPVTVVSGLAAAARRGILIKGGVYLEEARKLRVIALDKTGTITEGKPRLVATELLPSTVPESQVLAWAASLAGHSDHPVSKAIATGLKLPENGLTDFVALAGRGIEARTDGQLLVLGNHRLIEERNLCSAEIEARLQVHETQGRTVTMLASAQQVLAIFAVADTIKESSREAVADLHRLGVVSVMLTGDNVATAASIAKEAGIDDARGNLLPEDKLAAIEDLQRRYGPTAMTGDGINDAPALARADIGVAMGAAGTDTAMEAADVVIMNDDLRRIPETIRLSRRTHAVLWQNIGLALGIKAIFLGLAIFGNATMWMAVFADMGASLLVVGNGVRGDLLGVANRWEGWGYSLLLGGAVGNLVDRLGPGSGRGLSGLPCRRLALASLQSRRYGALSERLDSSLGDLAVVSSKQGDPLARAQEISMQILAINQNEEHKLAQRSFSLFDRRTLSALMLLGAGPLHFGSRGTLAS
jgi:Cd2+/Zn2+-exporting ATPase